MVAVVDFEVGAGGLDVAADRPRFPPRPPRLAPLPRSLPLVDLAGVSASSSSSSSTAFCFPFFSLIVFDLFPPLSSPALPSTRSSLSSRSTSDTRRFEGTCIARGRLLSAMSSSLSSSTLVSRSIPPPPKWSGSCWLSSSSWERVVSTTRTS